MRRRDQRNAQIPAQPLSRSRRSAPDHPNCVMTDIAAIPQNGTARPHGAADKKRNKGNDTMA
jgi:hypothetical protein